MTIRHKIFLNFSVVTVLLTGLAHGFVYTLFSEYREEEFQQRQKQKIITTLRFLTQIQKVESELIEEMDMLTINDLYDEKLLIFDSERSLIYSSIDDTPILFSNEILSRLSVNHPWIETKDGLYDVIGVYSEGPEASYYAISKAYDNFGYSKLRYLRVVLITAFAGISVIVIIVSSYLSTRITRSINMVTRKIMEYDFDRSLAPIESRSSRDEVAMLVSRFNELMGRVTTAFAFQKHAIHHISHELKTPISVLVSNLERMEKVDDPKQLKEMIASQKQDTTSLAQIINALLEIAKAESGNFVRHDDIRVDELIFETASELNQLDPGFQFHIELHNVSDETSLEVSGNLPLLKSAVSNLMTNCMQYSTDGQAHIAIAPENGELCIDFINSGPILDDSEKAFLFQHFFRGKNSVGKKGFGLGLVFIHRIVQLHAGDVTYRSTQNRNTFSIRLPLS